jgi:multidrug efflux pump subunit AcrA (membrane-fusion protein)
LAGIVAPYQNVAIQSSLTEPADSVDVQEGDRVGRGEVLARLDTADLQASLDADLATAASDRASTTHNVYQGGLSISQGVDVLRSAESAVTQAQANLQRDRTDLARYRQLVGAGYIAEQQVAQQQTTVRDDEQALRSDLNPDEHAWRHLTSHRVGRMGIRNRDELEAAARMPLRFFSRIPHELKAFFNGPMTRYARVV